MRRNRLCTLSLAVLLAASCKTTSPQPDPVVTQTQAQELPQQWLVWTSDDAGSQTHLVGPDGKTVAVAPGTWIGTENGLWQLEMVPLPVEQHDCDCEMEAFNKGEEPPASCVTTAQLEVSSLEPAGEGAALHVPTSEYLANDARSVYSTLDGNVGPYVFATSCIEEYTCGAAHGGTVCSQWIWDLRTQEPVDKFSMAADPLRGEAALQFVREAFEDEQEGQALQSEDIQLTWVAPAFEDGLTPRMEEQYTAPTCYACSDGAWDSYTLSTRRTVDTLPEAMKSWMEDKTPPAADVSGEIGGWSVMPADKVLREKFESAAKFVPPMPG